MLMGFIKSKTAAKLNSSSINTKFYEHKCKMLQCEMFHLMNCAHTSIWNGSGKLI